MASTIHNLGFNFKNYWHAGTGITGGNHLDAIVQKDSDGLPMLNGRHIKGLLRQVVRLNEGWGAFSDICKPQADRPDAERDHFWETLLFGSRNQEDSSDETHSGLIYVSDARLSKQEASYISNNGLNQYLYKTLFNTKINENGVAEDKTLRAIEVAVPMLLTAELEIDTSDAGVDNKQDLLTSFTQIIEKSLPLVRYAGGHRTRGLGRVSVTIMNQHEEMA